MTHRGAIHIPISRVVAYLPFIKLCHVYDCSISDDTFIYFCIHPDFAPVPDGVPTPHYTVTIDEAGSFILCPS